jgi:hypothetical protein
VRAHVDDDVVQREPAGVRQVRERERAAVGDVGGADRLVVTERAAQPRAQPVGGENDLPEVSPRATA